MKKVTLFTNATVISIIATTMIAAPAFACKPVGSIVKSVQDQTTNSATATSNSTTNALTVNSNDSLLYTITVKNSGAPESNGDDDMLNVQLTDTLPSGVQLVSDSSQTKISESLGTIKPGDSVTKTYSVKVTDDTNGAVLTNTACYSGGSMDNLDNQSGCDTAVVKVNVPAPTPTTPPATTTTPTTPSTTAPSASAPTTLPNTGSTAFSASILVISTAVAAYALNLLRVKFQTKSQN